MHSVKIIVINILKGFIIGIGALIPGVSGGTTAIIVGAFEDIIEATANFFLHIKKSIIFLFTIAIGAFLSIPITTTIINSALNKHYLFANCTFLILSLISTALFVKKQLDFNITPKRFYSLIFGVLLAIIILLSKELNALNLIDYNWYILIILGIPLSLALVLPAISFSYMMYFFGLYERFLLALKYFEIEFLFFLGVGILMGAFLFSKIFIRISENHPQEIYYFIFGFVLCSNIDILFRILNY